MLKKESMKHIESFHRFVVSISAYSEESINDRIELSKLKKYKSESLDTQRTQDRGI